MRNSMSGSRSAAAAQAKSSASNQIRRAITGAKSAVRKNVSIAPVEGGVKK